MKRCLAASAVVFSILIAACTGQLHSGAQPAYHTPYGVQAHSATFGLPPAGLSLIPPATAVQTLEMRDSIAVSAIPAGTPAVAGYLEGRWPDFAGMVRAFPKAYHVPIAVFDTPIYKSTVGRMACLDVEPGDATPAQSGSWAKGELGLGVKPCLYANLSTMPAVKASLVAHGLKRSQYFLWDADWTFHAHLDNGYNATQWTDRGSHGENYDESTVTLPFLGVTSPTPAVLPVCFHKRESKAACTAVKAKIASDQRAAAASANVYKTRGCDVLSQRISWFSTQLHKHPHTKAQNRRRALKASRTAYRQRSCSVFAQRQRWFTAAATKLEAAN